MFALSHEKLFATLLPLHSPLTQFKLYVPVTATVQEATAVILASVFVALAGLEVDATSVIHPVDAVSVQKCKDASTMITFPVNSLLAMIGGFCNVPGECICRENYFGAHCEVGWLFIHILTHHINHPFSVCAQISFHVTEMLVVPALKECSALMMDREATYVTVQLAPLMWNVKLNVIPVHVCINPPVL